MIDEHFMRDWNAGHVRFSADVDRALAKIGRLLGARSGKDSIGAAYARAPARTLVSGLAAVATTVALLVTVAALAAPPAVGKTSNLVELASTIEHGGVPVEA